MLVRFYNTLLKYKCDKVPIRKNNQPKLTIFSAFALMTLLSCNTCTRM